MTSRAPVRVATILAVAAGSIASALAQTADPEARPVPSIAVTGHAVASVTPDVAVIALGVTSDRPRASDAMADNNAIAQKLTAIVREAGIAPRDVATTAVDLEAVYDRPAKGVPSLTGYHASLTMEIRVKPIERAGALVSALTDAGANSVDSIDFVVSPDPARDDGLKAEATRDARRLADIYVGALGLKLGRVLTIAPGEVVPPEPRHALKHRYMRGQSAAAAPAVPLAAGTQDLAADATVTFEILQ